MPLTGRRTTHRTLARTQCITCSACGSKQRYHIERQRTWATWLGLPLVPLSTAYRYRCPACENSHALVRRQAMAMARQAARHPEG